MTTVTIGGQTFYSGGLPVFVNDVAYFVNAIDGWEEGADPDISRVSRGGGNGQVVSKTRKVAKEITMKGIAFARDDDAMWTARTRLPQIFDLVTSPGILVVNEPIPKQCEVYRDGRLAVTKQGHALKFEADLFSPDWRRFGTSDTTLALTIPAGSLSKQANTSNAGNVESHPRITITGPAVNPRIADMTTGDELDLGVTLQGTDILVIDMLDQAVTLNGLPADNLVTGGEWWTLLPGSHSLRYRVTQTSAGDSTATVTARSAYA